MTGEELTVTAAVLRRVLAEIEAGEIPADLDHAAYLRGAADTLAMLAGLAEGSGECPETKVVGCGQHAETGETFPQDD